jgi:hypothetical protein
MYNIINKKSIKIFGVYFICCINNYLDVVKEQLNILNQGLIHITTKLIIFITKYDINTCSELDNILNKYNKFILIKTSDNLYEKFAINNYKQYINEKDYYLYYFHTKGLKNINDPLLHIFTSRRQILNFYTLSQYKINIKLLDLYDAIGCSLHLYPKRHFSGNFWWSKSSYLLTLENINNGYLSPEMYILSNNNCKYISLANDTNNILINNYKFPNEITIKKNLTSQFIIINEHKNLIHLCG